MRYPKFLQPQGTIGFVAPSFGCTGPVYGAVFDKAIEKFNQMGYLTVEGPCCRKSDGIGRSSSAENCGREMTDEYISDRSDVLISCGGGELMCEGLPFVDFEVIRKAEPKWFMGYSDNTNMTFLLPVLCDTAAIYGPCAGTFGQGKWHEAVQDAWDVITGRKLELFGYEKWEKESLKSETNPYVSFNVTEPSRVVSVPAADGSTFISGRLIGGCMDILQLLVGTPYDRVSDFCERYKDDGIIWFMEACDLNVMSIRRALWQMEQAGWFRYVKGFIFGRPMHFDEGFLGMDQYRAVTGICAKYNVPIIMDADLGHLPPAIPFISGALADIDVVNERLHLKMRLE